MARGALEAAAKGEGLPPGARVKDTCAALVKRTEGAIWKFRGARFELPGDEFTRGTHEYRYVPGRPVVDGDGQEANGDNQEGHEIAT